MSDDKPAKTDVVVSQNGKVLAKLPLFLRKFIYDTIATFTAGLLIMSLANIYEAGWNALAVAFATAALKSAVSNSGDFFAWLRDQLGLALLTLRLR